MLTRGANQIREPRSGFNLPLVEVAQAGGAKRTGDRCSALPQGVPSRPVNGKSRSGAKYGPSPWFECVLAALEEEYPPTTADLARAIGRNPDWLARVYRSRAGEGLRETIRRRRVERAVTLLRNSDLSLAQIAVEVGFCDQSHMNRSIRALAGQTRLQVRAQRGGTVLPLEATKSVAACAGGGQYGTTTA